MLQKKNNYVCIKFSKILFLILAKLQGKWTDVVNPYRVFIIHQTRLDQLHVNIKIAIILSSSLLIQEFKNVRFVGHQENISSSIFSNGKAGYIYHADIIKIGKH